MKLQLGDALENDNRGSPIPLHVMVMITLLYLATNSFQIVVATAFGIDQGTVSRVVKKVVDALVTRSSDFICFPPDEEGFQKLKDGFFAVSRFPHVIGMHRLPT